MYHVEYTECSTLNFVAQQRHWDDDAVQHDQFEKGYVCMNNTESIESLHALY